MDHDDHDDVRRRAALAAFAQAPFLLYVMEGPELRIAAYNQVMARMIGDRPVGTPMAEAFPELLTQQLVGMWEEVARTGVPQRARDWRFQVNVEGGGTVETYVDFELVPWRGEDGEVLGVIAAGVDVTERATARLRSEQEHRRLGRQLVEARELITTLQASLLPDALPVLPGLDVTARYLLASEDTAAGGDWFDAVVREDGGSVALVVGDVVGHGVVASAVMGRLRAVLQQRLLSGAPVAEALADLDVYARVTPGAQAATVCVVELDPRTGEMSWCTAGHPPPLVVAVDGHARYLRPTGSGPLGTGADFATASGVVGPDELLLLYSDGVVERPGRTPMQNTVELLEVVGDAYVNRVMPGHAPTRTGDRVCEQTLELLTRATGYADDITLLAAHRTRRPAPFVFTGRSGPGAVGAVREELACWLELVDVSAGDFVVAQHTAGELVSNVVEHAYSAEGADGVVEVRAHLDGRGDLVVEVRDRGRWRAPAARPGRGRGRGLAMVRTLVDGLDVAHDEGGTTATARHRLTRQPRLLTVAGTPGGVTGPALDGVPYAAEVDDERAVVTVRGPVDLVTAPQLGVVLGRATRGGQRPVEVDLAAVTVLSSAGVQVLHELVATTELRLSAPPGSAAHHVMGLVDLPRHVPRPG